MAVTLDNALSGALGAFAILLLQEFRNSLKQHQEDIIGTISLMYVIQSNIHALVNIRKNIIAQTREEITAFRESNLENVLEFSTFGADSEPFFNFVENERNITLKHASFGCFYTLNQHNHFLKILDIAIKELNVTVSEYQQDFFRADRKADYNAAYLDFLEREMSFFENTLRRIQTVFVQLLNLINTSVNDVPLHHCLRRFAYYKQRQDIKDLNSILRPIRVKVQNEIDTLRSLNSNR